MSQQEQRLHPKVLAVKDFIDDSLTQEEFQARAFSVLSVIPHQFVLEFSTRIQQHMMEQHQAELENAPEVEQEAE